MASVPRKPRKADLPEKVCLVCGRPFSWRKKWQDCWPEVKYCSERCRRRRPSAKLPRQLDENFCL